MVVSLGCEEAPTEQERRKTPDFVLTSLEGEEYQLSEQQGQVVVLHFFKTTCPICQRTAPEMVEVRKRVSQEDGAIWGIALDSQNSVARADSFKEEYNINYPILIDSIGVGRAYGVNQTPTTFLVGKDGWIEERVTGSFESDQLVELIGEVAERGS